MFFFVRVIRFDAHAFSRLLHINLNLLREGFSLVARVGLNANRRGDFHVSARLAVDTTVPLVSKSVSVTFSVEPVVFWNE